MSHAYDEDRELTRYVAEYLGAFMTEFEARVWRAYCLSAKRLQGASSNSLSPKLREWIGLDDPAVEAELADGPEAFRRRVRDRVLAEAWAAAAVNRCPSCRRIVRTPQARQCFWCGCDWHP